MLASFFFPIIDIVSVRIILNKFFFNNCFILLKLSKQINVNYKFI